MSSLDMTLNVKVKQGLDSKRRPSTVSGQDITMCGFGVQESTSPVTEVPPRFTNPIWFSCNECGFTRYVLKNMNIALALHAWFEKD